MVELGGGSRVKYGDKRKGVGWEKKKTGKKHGKDDKSVSAVIGAKRMDSLKDAFSNRFKKSQLESKIELRRV